MSPVTLKFEDCCQEGFVHSPIEFEIYPSDETGIKIGKPLPRQYNEEFGWGYPSSSFINGSLYRIGARLFVCRNHNHVVYLFEVDQDKL